MSRTNSTLTDECFELVADAHRFLLSAIPLRHPASAEALHQFLVAVRARRTAAAVRRAVFLQVLMILDRHTRGRVPSLVERYLCSGDDNDCCQRFRCCVEDVLKYRGVGNLSVQRAIDVMEQEFANPQFKLPVLAQMLRRTSPKLAALFKAETGLTVHEYLKQLRLARAAELLRATNQSVKEVWVSVGYNHASDFDHQFRIQFGVTPSEYRRKVIRAAIPPASVDVGRPAEAAVDVRRLPRERDEHTVLIVDDDDGTRETIATYLRLEGYVVTTVGTTEGCFEQVARSVPRAILLDYRLADGDGLECLRKLRRLHPKSRISVILFSADWELEDHWDEIRQLDATMTSKLCDLDDLGRLIGRTTGRC
jgi:AraC-like DNA-binding protein/CheY-like chemotaxis protein